MSCCEIPYFWTFFTCLSQLKGSSPPSMDNVTMSFQFETHQSLPKTLEEPNRIQTTLLIFFLRFEDVCSVRGVQQETKTPLCNELQQWPKNMHKNLMMYFLVLWKDSGNYFNSLETPMLVQRWPLELKLGGVSPHEFSSHTFASCTISMRMPHQRGRPWATLLDHLNHFLRVQNFHVGVVRWLILVCFCPQRGIDYQNQPSSSCP